MVHLDKQEGGSASHTRQFPHQRDRSIDSNVAWQRKYMMCQDGCWQVSKLERAINEVGARDIGCVKWSVSYFGVQARGSLRWGLRAEDSRELIRIGYRDVQVLCSGQDVRESPRVRRNGFARSLRYR